MTNIWEEIPQSLHVFCLYSKEIFLSSYNKHNAFNGLYSGSVQLKTYNEQFINCNKANKNATQHQNTAELHDILYKYQIT